MNRLTILCVDDERNVLFTLRTQLSRHFPGYRIEIAESGEEALGLVEDLLATGDKVSLVIADQIMPGIKGNELLIELHNRHPEILKVMLTGQARAEDIGNVINRGSLYRFIAKPWNETDLILTVTEALRRYQQDRQLAQQQAVLEQANRELEALNASLEQQVRERTQQLQYQEGKLKETQHLARLGGWELNLKSGEEYWSEEIYTIHELPLECDRPSCLEHPEYYINFYAPEARPSVQAAFHKAITCGEAYELEVPLITAQGNHRWVKTYGQPILENGVVVRITGVLGDITDRKQAEVALQKLNQELEQRVEERTQELVQSQQILQESEQRFRQLAENIDQVFWLAPADQSQTIYVSPTFEKIWGHPCEALYCSPMLWLDVIHPDDRDRILLSLERTVDGGHDHEYRIVRPDGEIRWIRDRAFPIRNDTGQVYRVAGIAEDISERKQQEAERKQSELLLRRQVAAVEAALDGIAILNGDNYIYLNKAHADIFGYDSPAELLGKTWRELYRPQELCFFEQEVFPVLMQQKYWQGEVIAKRKDGTTFDEEISLVITEDGDLICVCRDISERQAALREREEVQRDLQESRNMLKLVLDTIPQRVFWKDNQSRFLGCNPAFANDYQLTYEDIVGKTDLELPWAEWGELYRSDDISVMNSSIPKLNYEEPTNNLNGEQIWIRSNKIPLTNSQGNIIGILGCYEDITERKLAEEALQAEQLRLKLALDAAQMATWSCNLQMDRLIWSERAQQIFGFEPGTFPGDWETFTTMIYPEDYDRVIQAIVHTFETGDRYEIEYRIRRLDGEIRWVSVWEVIPKYTSPDERQIVGVVVDISDRKQAEAAIRQANAELETRVEERTAQLKQAAQAAEAANRAKSEFLANVSHELRTPLNGILGYAQILRDSPQLNPKEQQGIEVIRRCGSHLLTLINDILDLAKIEAQRLELSPSEFHFPSFLQNLADICRLRATEKGIQFFYAVDPDLPSSICADEKRLRQILLNLLGNALKFTEQGNVTFKIELKQQDSKLKSQIVRFQIEDTGIGISPEQVEGILLPFEQAGDPMHKAQGTGLGLAITRNLLKLMGSTLQITSQPGQGSNFGFEIELQIAYPAVQQVVAPPARIKGFKGQPRQILIIDDQVDNRLVFRNLLEPLEFIILEANNGKTGLEQAIEYQPDLLIVDLVMPEMNGIQMLHHLRELPQGKTFKVIVSSARAFAEDRQQSFAAGADDFLAKPVQAAVLLNLVQKHLNLEWCYETFEPEATLVLETQDSKEPTAMAIPEKAVLAQLLDLALRGNIQKLLTQIEVLERSDPGMKPLTTQLRTWIESFQLKKIRNFLHSLNSQKNSQN